MRVPDADATYIKQVLDLGPVGILAPEISSARQAAELVAACKYPPVGRRGTGTGRATRYGLAGAHYRRHANDEVAVLAMLETEDAIEQAEEIVAVPGLDGVFVGPHDLAAQMGIPDDAPEIERATLRVIEAANRHGIAVGTYVPPADVAKAIRQGMTLVMSYTDFAGLGRSSRQAFDTVSLSIADE